MRSDFRSKPRRLLAILALFLSTGASALETKSAQLIPPEVVLNRTGEEHRLLAEGQKGDLWTGDLTAGTRFISSNNEVATVSKDGIVRSVGDGEATIRAIVNGIPMSAQVKVKGTQEPFQWSFRNHVQPVLFKAGCNTGACHGAAAGKNGFKLSLRGFDFDRDHEVLTREAQGRRVSLAEPEESLILLKPTMQVPHEGGERFGKGSKNYDILLEWIKAGASPAHEEDPRITRIEVIPSSITLPQGATQQVIVRAHYNNDTYEDVTDWVKYATTRDTVALVDDNGVITVSGPGSTAITAWYSSKVAFTEVTVPRKTDIPDEVFAQAERVNFIDDLIIKKLASLEIAPAEKSSDETFIRRAYLDTLGILPTAQETEAFVATEDRDKRDQLIDYLLTRPEFVDYWSYKWSDLLLLSSKNLPQAEELNAFYRFIRKSVEENKPWDQFARDILTAKGSTYDNGATAFFKMHKETTDLTETTSQAFLGTSITCARCHNHPLEKWTQNDYYGMANLLSRVKLKNGERQGSTEILPAAFGNILNPRIGEPMPPKPLDGDPISLDNPGDRREVLADWLTAPDNPYFARAIVNRVWKNFMGKGLVEPVDDLRLTNPPSNEALFAALEKDLIARHYDLKHLMRTIMRSAAHQKSSAPSNPDQPDNDYFSQYIIRRLPAEVILDAYSEATGVPTAFNGYPAGSRALQLRDSQVASYFLSAFGRPERRQTCECERTQDPSIAQTLHIANGETLNDKLKDKGSVVTEYIEKEMTNEQILEDLFLRTLSRKPTETEKEKSLSVLVDVSVTSEPNPENRRAALEDLAWAVMSSKEFLFNH